MEKLIIFFSAGFGFVIAVYWIIYPTKIIEDIKKKAIFMPKSETWMDSKYGSKVFRVVGVIFAALCLFTIYISIFQ